jgi:hypothetical protein
VTAEQQQDGAAECVRAFLQFYGPDDEIVGYTHDFRLNAADLRAVLAERDALAARVAELTSSPVHEDLHALIAERNALIVRVAELERQAAEANDFARTANRALADRDRDHDKLAAKVKRLETNRKYGTYVQGNDGIEWIPCEEGSLRVYGCRCPVCSSALATDAAQDGRSATESNAGPA